MAAPFVRLHTLSNSDAEDPFLYRLIYRLAFHFRSKHLLRDVRDTPAVFDQLTVHNGMNINNIGVLRMTPATSGQLARRCYRTAGWLVCMELDGTPVPTESHASHNAPAPSRHDVIAS
jgi:hypothetical protein